MRPVTQKDRDQPFGRSEGEGIPGVHPDARTVIVTRYSDKGAEKFDTLYSTESLRPLVESAQGTPRSSLSQTAQLALAVIDLGNPGAVEIPLLEGKIVGAYEEAARPGPKAHGPRRDI